MSGKKTDTSATGKAMMETAKRAQPRDDYVEEEERRSDAPPELPCLPPEIVREILIRLHAKSIGRFRDLGAVEIPESHVMVNLVSLYYPEDSFEMVGSGLAMDSVSKEERFYGVGFRFDSITDDYKVAALITGDVLNASVYSLKTDSWKWVGDSRCRYDDVDISSYGLLVNGAIHWVARRREDGQRVVVAFDLTTEQFKDMALPDEAEDCPHELGEFELHKLNGRLCMV
ncbi:PREDICTED: F-box/kelch-repeat protein At3g06240-like [Tarenaya hassleriana]|uniref:F-box/kelch-repeat protein At3g06240-like n=1 Tax=Tarenaya hassleriana TaxID=28532 RepID=UPI00053C5458|nr:PREDICTED: F-box/kelch-repeat protein At3g06240-like [Tarenaya hassleriana]